MPPLDEEIRKICGQLIACEDEAEIRALAGELQRLLHEAIEEARSQIRVLPFLEAPASRGKRVA